jgi:hypothetical protein
MVRSHRADHLSHLHRAAQIALPTRFGDRRRTVPLMPKVHLTIAIAHTMHDRLQ